MFLQKISGPAIRLGSLEIWADKLGAKKKEENNKKKNCALRLSLLLKFAVFRKTRFLRRLPAGSWRNILFGRPTDNKDYLASPIWTGKN